jgi:RNA polymerase sigma factor (sigma-70 family)
LTDPSRTHSFETLIRPCLSPAYSLARWLTGNAADAEDVVQEALLRALRFFDDYRGGDARAWILRIVRNTAHTWRAANRPTGAAALEAQGEVIDAPWPGAPRAVDPADAALREAERAALRAAIAALPADFREVVVLRDLEDCSYKEIAAILAIPTGTVMSRLSRGRDQLARALRAPAAAARKTSP